MGQLKITINANAQIEPDVNIIYNSIIQHTAETQLLHFTTRPKVDELNLMG